MNPEEYPMYRGLSFQLSRPNAYRVLERLVADDKLYTRLLRADIDAWPELKAAVSQATAMRASAEARRVIDGIV